MTPRPRPVALWALTAMVIAMVVATAVLSARSLSRLVTAQEALTQTLRVDKVLQSLQIHLLNAETGQRGYLLTGRVDYLEPYYGALGAMRGDMRLLESQPQAAGDDGSVRKALSEAVAAKLTEMDRTVRLYDAGKVDEALEVVRSGAGKRSMDAVRAAGTRLTAAEDQRTAERSAQQDVEILNARAVFAFSMLLNLVLLASLVFRMAANARESRAAQQAMAARNEELAEVLDATRTRSSHVHALAELSRYLQSALHIDEAALLLREHLPHLLNADSGALYLMASSRNQLRSACTWGSGSWVELLDPTECWALRRGQALHRGGGKAGLTCAHLSGAGEPCETTAATECLPLLAHGDLVGLLVLANCDDVPRSQFADDLEFQQMTLEQVALCIGNLRLRESLRQQSIRDVLTGLYNRRFLEESLQRELMRVARLDAQGTQPGLALLMLDVDHFKRFNDQHGHDVGDRVLRDVAQALQRRSRGSDVTARHGGEEFVVLLPDMDAATAVQRAELLRQDVEQLSLRADGQVLGPITISIGVAHCAQGGSTSERLLREADKALYEAKRAGRNRVVLGGQAQAAQPAQPAQPAQQALA